MRKRQQSKTIVVILAGAGVTSGAFATVIDFDGTGAPNVFSETTALRDLYAGLGVNFDGPGPLDGGAILNEGGNFGVGAHSGTDFLAFNRNSMMMDGGVPRDPEEILFDDLQASVSIYAAGGVWDAATFRMDAYDQLDQLVDTDTVSGGNWAQLLVSHPDGIARVVLTEIAMVNYFVYDDLEFFAVPGPPCPWDLDASGDVGVSDLLSLLASWGPCKGCPADFDGNGNVGVSDLLALLANWGPCP